MHTVQTRIATLADVDVIAPLFDAYRQFYAQPADLALATRFIHDRLINNESVILLALQADQQLVGLCQLYPSFCSVEAKPIYALYDLFVTPPARRLGVAKALLLAAERQAVASGKARMDLATAKTNTVAQAAYAALGWIKDERFYTYSKAING